MAFPQGCENVSRVSTWETTDTPWMSSEEGTGGSKIVLTADSGPPRSPGRRAPRTIDEGIPAPRKFSFHPDWMFTTTDLPYLWLPSLRKHRPDYWLVRCLAVVRAFFSPPTSARAPYYAGDKHSTRLWSRKWLFHNLSPSHMGIPTYGNNISNESKFVVLCILWCH